MGDEFLLRIDSPCHEHWHTMRPEERGRFCGSCQKTVVDFTAMSDAEVVQFLSRAGQNVCGRFGDQQLRRPMSVKPESLAARGRRVWYWLVAGLLMVTRVQGQKTMGKVKAAPTHVVEQPLLHIHTDLPVIEPPKQPLDTVKRLVEKVYCSEVTVGMVVTGIRVKKKNVILPKIKDTLVAIKVLPRQMVKVFPSPVQRGAAIQLSWDTVSGDYKVGLYNMSGALIFERPMQVGAAKQVDLMEIPANIAAGVYVLRVAGEGRPFSKKIVVM